MAEEAAKLKPLLDVTYYAIGRFQADRSPANENRLRDAMGPVVEQLMLFRPYMPTYKQHYFNVLEAEWHALPARDLIMLFDHCVDIMHLRMTRHLTKEEAQQPWSREMLGYLDKRRDAPEPGPATGDFLCAGIAASPGQVAGLARVVLEEADLADLKPGEILVCPMSTPEWVPYLDRVRAVVTDQGGALCHAAIIARELGLACVTGCREATRVISTGQYIEVNGDLGIITCP